MINRTIIICAALIFTCLVSVAAAAQKSGGAATSASLKWSDILKQKADWYASDEAVRIACNVLLYQRETGGWPKNIDMAKVLTEAERASLVRQKQETDSTIDNGATYTQLVYLARVYTARKIEGHRQAFERGLDYLLKAQYANGGWPQYYPLRKGYYTHITFNDDAMINVMRLLRDVAQKKSSYLFVDETRRSLAERAVERGIELILKTQIVVDGKRTIWDAQYDEVTLKPAAARRFEPTALVSRESVSIVRFLMQIKQPGPQVIEAIEAAVNWFEKTKLSGIRWVERADPSKPQGFERVVVKDPNAGPLWARFYEMGTNRPIFVGRDAVIKYDVMEIEAERRNGYGWYSEEPAELLNEDYPAWRKKLER
ncbi:MAG: pectate lyase [Pyrinomonadaceae bacterium]|nr:pectate lyase [Pyrinomonadaceae bacterium]